jgi:hypothetical protein
MDLRQQLVVSLLFEPVLGAVHAATLLGTLITALDEMTLVAAPARLVNHSVGIRTQPLPAQFLSQFNIVTFHFSLWHTNSR